MKITWKRTLALILVFVMTLVLLAGCGANQDDEGDLTQKKHVIGVACAQAESVAPTFFKEFLGPTYNVEFIISEVLQDDTATKAFIENCIDAGAEAIIDFRACSGQMARLCEENGLYYIIQNSYESHPEFLQENFPMFAGAVDQGGAQTAELFSQWLKENTSETGEEGFLVASIIASAGNSLHIDVTTAILTALQDKYGLTYEKSIEELVASPDVTNAENDKGILITIYPGASTQDTWLPGASALIQSGRYGVFLSCGATYSQSATVVDEVERNMNMNIKVVSLSPMGDGMTNAFNTLDVFGNPSVDMLAVSPVSVQTAELFALAYNALTGYNDSLNRTSDGKPVMLLGTRMAVTSQEQANAMADWDSVEKKTWAATKEFTDSLLGFMNPDLTSEECIRIVGSVDFETLSK